MSAHNLAARVASHIAANNRTVAEPYDRAHHQRLHELAEAARFRYEGAIGAYKAAGIALTNPLAWTHLEQLDAAHCKALATCLQYGRTQLDFTTAYAQQQRGLGQLQAA